MKIGHSELLVGLQFGLIGAMTLYATDGRLESEAVVLFLIGAAIGLAAIYAHPRGNFNIRPDIKSQCTLIKHGIYRHIRHPMYTSVMVMGGGVALLRNDTVMWAMWAALVSVLILKAKREERLWSERDACYRDYMCQSKRFIPYIF